MQVIRHDFQVSWKDGDATHPYLFILREPVSGRKVCILSLDSRQ
jgi:hypothetical protein